MAAGADPADHLDRRDEVDDDDSLLPRPVARPAERRQAIALLWRAARPDAATLRAAVVWMLAAGVLEAIGPVLGKHFIDDVLRPRHAGPTLVAGLLAGTRA